ncbi:MAG: M20 family metallopeptidase, partial [Anaerolineae bacterium]
LFQPAEEASDEEGLSGASRMIEDGAMEGVDAVLALHVYGGSPVGDVMVASGPVGGGADSFYATIAGRGAHGAYPHKGLDPILIAAHVILALNSIVSRRLDPFDAAVISLGSVHAGQASNVIPERVELSGTVRYEQPEVQKQLHAEIERAFQVARTLGGDYQLEIEIGYPPMVNDEGMVNLLQEVATALLGAGNVKPREKGLGAEDFGYFSALAPGAMFRLGCQLGEEERKGHSPTFDLDERCLPIGAAVLAEAARRLLCRA